MLSNAPKAQERATSGGPVSAGSRTVVKLARAALAALDPVDPMFDALCDFAKQEGITFDTSRRRGWHHMRCERDGHNLSVTSWVVNSQSGLVSGLRIQGEVNVDSTLKGKIEPKGKIISKIDTLRGREGKFSVKTNDVDAFTALVNESHVMDSTSHITHKRLTVAPKKGGGLKVELEAFGEPVNGEEIQDLVNGIARVVAQLEKAA